ncbi:MAG: DNA circularization N-terminal domain-containing protein [Marinagarivorans sp.]|nr:DNA circularization N-terminal domain-containing protein [Marinagarivorans sp.]
MSWIERIRQAAYTSPSGVRTVFLYEDLSKSIEKKTTAFDFADADGTYVQDRGLRGQRYPMRLYIAGADYDLTALAFEQSLEEAGAGLLEHPIDGSINAIAFGVITRNDALATAANQAVFDVEFWETLINIYPISQLDPAAAVSASIAEFNESSALQLEQNAKIGGPVERTNFKSRYQALLSSASSVLSPIAAAQENVQEQFDSINSSINQGIDTLVSDPLTLAFQTVLLIQSPARASALIVDRLRAYRNLAAQIVDGFGSDDIASADLYATAYVSGSVVSVINNQFTTKTDALAAAQELLAQFDEVVAWRDESYADSGIIDTGLAYKKLQDAVSLAAGYLVYISFTLKQERAIVLDRDRTIIDLCAELYGNIDEQLDFIIQSNSLTGSEILELRRGRRIVYYI